MVLAQVLKKQPVAAQQPSNPDRVRRSLAVKVYLGYAPSDTQTAVKVIDVKLTRAAADKIASKTPGAYTTKKLATK